MNNILTWDEVLDGLANYQITVRPAEDQILIKNGDELPVDVRLTMRYWQAAQPQAREALMQYVCAVASGKVRDLVDYRDPEYRAVIPERAGVVE